MRNKVLRKILLLISEMITALCAVIIIYATVSEGDTSVLGYRIFIVKSGSMHGTFEVGDLIVIKKAKKERLKEGVIISFISSDPDILGEINTHRIIGIDGDEYVTKGDAAKSADNITVKFEDVLGEYCWKSAFAGLVLRWVGKPLNMLFFVILPTVFVIWLELGGGSKKIKRLLLKYKKKKPVGNEQEILKMLLTAPAVHTNNSIQPNTEVKTNEPISPQDLLAILSKEARLEKLVGQIIDNSRK